MVRDVAKCGALEPHTGYDCEREAGHELPHLAFIDAHDEVGPLPEREWSVAACAVELDRNARCLFPQGHDGPHGTDTVAEGNKNSHLQRTTTDLDEARRYVERCQAHNTRLVARHEVEMSHARKQSHADGFQAGWHAALQRVWEGDRVVELRQLCPQPAESRWHPIETAPKGMDVLVCEGRFRVRVAFHGPAGWRTMPGDIGIHPTHWQPLPTPVVAHSSTRNKDVAHIGPTDKYGRQLQDDGHGPWCGIRTLGLFDGAKCTCGANDGRNQLTGVEKLPPSDDKSKWFVIHKLPCKPVEWIVGFDTDQAVYEYCGRMRGLWDEHTYLCEVQQFFLVATTHTARR